MKSPFKFLDAYTAKDKDIFFGREKEIDELYNMVFKTPLVMVYGLSGTGKSSLVQCGLATKFDGPDWLPILVRKEDDINESLRKALNTTLNEKEQINDLNVLIEKLFYKYFRPVYLLFDQFEELFILEDDNEAEQIKFMEDIHRLQKAELPCRIILIIREEYIGQLYGFEKIIPTIFDYKLRVEPMSDKYIRQVMLESFNAFNIELEDPVDDRIQQIMSKLRVGKSDIPLPYLQVYLDRLYKKDYEITYPNGSKEKLPPLKFTQKEISAFGGFDDVLERFLKEQVINIQQQIRKEDATFPKDGVRTVLDVFVTDEGTKRPIPYVRKNEEIIIDEKIKYDEFPKIEAISLSNCINSLEQSKILRFRDNTIELAHDTLANLINEQRTDEQRTLNEIRKEIKSTYHIHQKLLEDNKEGSYLSEGQLEWYKPLLNKLRLKEYYYDFVLESEQYRKDVRAEEKAKRITEIKKERELRKKAVDAQNIAEENANRATKYTRMAMGIAAITAFTAIAAVWSLIVAEEAKEKAELSLLDAKQADIKRLESEIEIAQNNLISFRHYEANEVDVILYEQTKINEFIEQKDSLTTIIYKIKNDEF